MQVRHKVRERSLLRNHRPLRVTNKGSLPAVPERRDSESLPRCSRRDGIQSGRRGFTRQHARHGAVERTGTQLLGRRSGLLNEFDFIEQHARRPRETDEIDQRTESEPNHRVTVERRRDKARRELPARRLAVCGRDRQWSSGETRDPLCAQAVAPPMQTIASGATAKLVIRSALKQPLRQCKQSPSGTTLPRRVWACYPSSPR